MLSGAVTGTSYVQANGQTIAKINESGNISYYHSDHIGSISAVTDEQGEVISSAKYSVFGSPLSETEERFGFTSKEQDETGLQYFGARYYLHGIGRFLTSDAAMDGINWYSYAANNPLKYVDPTGNLIEINWGQLTDEEVIDTYGVSKKEVEEAIKEGADYRNPEYATSGPVDFVNDESFKNTVEVTDTYEFIRGRCLFYLSKIKLNLLFLKFAADEGPDDILYQTKRTTSHEFSHEYDHQKGLVGEKLVEYQKASVESLETGKMTVSEFQETDIFKNNYVPAMWNLQLTELYARIREFKRFDHPYYLENHRYSPYARRNTERIQKRFRLLVFFTKHWIKGTPAKEVYKLFQNKKD